MIEPKKMKTYGKKKSLENWAFRAFLKNTIENEEAFDRVVNRLHKQYFSETFCQQCRNCCKMTGVCLQEETDLCNAASALNMSKEALIKRYLKQDTPQSYSSRRQPTCIFFQNESCMLKDGKPSSCKDFPYTQKPDRFLSLMSMVSAAEICPIAAQIMEDLKKEYHFEREKAYYLSLMTK